MASPAAWSFSSLDKFMTCPRQYYFMNVLKQYKQEQSTEMKWGEEVHKYFENYVKDGTPLPKELHEHYDYLNRLRQRPGKVEVELNAALDIRCRPTAYFGKDTWCRMRIDYVNFDGTTVRIVDYKTGKLRPKPDQLKLNMLWAFAAGAELCEAEFYWTQTKTVTKIVFPRQHSPAILKGFKPKLAEYAEAWHKDIWQPRPSGLCNGWCPVTECEYHNRGNRR